MTGYAPREMPARLMRAAGIYGNDSVCCAADDSGLRQFDVGPRSGGSVGGIMLSKQSQIDLIAFRGQHASGRRCVASTSSLFEMRADFARTESVDLRWLCGCPDSLSCASGTAIRGPARGRARRTECLGQKRRERRHSRRSGARVEPASATKPGVPPWLTPVHAQFRSRRRW